MALQGDFSSAVELQLLPGLGLTRTHINVPAYAMPSYAWGYDAGGNPVRVNPGMLDAETYGIKSTAADMIRFVQLNIDASELALPLRRAIEDTHKGYFRAEEMVQGLGWEQYPYPGSVERLLAGNSPTMIMGSNAVTQISSPRIPAGSTLFNKTGSTNGFGAYVAFVPQLEWV